MYIKLKIMKKLIKKVTIGSLLILSSVTLFSFNNFNKKTTNQQEQPTACKHGQCQATAVSTGNRCLHCVSNAGDSYCWQH